MELGHSASHPTVTPRHLRVVGKFLFQGEHKLEVRGVTYGTFRPGPQGVPFPDAPRVSQDFRRMAEAGFNAVRVYTPPPRRLLDEAARAGLHVLVGLSWEQHVAFLDEPSVLRTVEARVRMAVAECRSHPALLGYAIGNEIPAHIVRWLGARRVEAYLRRLHDLVEDLDPGALVTYVNYPSTEYLELPFLDVVAFNVFLESTATMSNYVARLQHLAGDRPLLITELGLDSRRHGVEAQARLAGEQITAARRAGCAGTFVFSWTDEWHRGGWDVLDWDFGLTTRSRHPKPALEAARHAVTRPLAPRAGTWPRITAVVCVYNGARWIADCLDGLARLRYPDYEVVVVDDGSTDATPEIVARHDVTSIRTENRGLSRARNTGIAAATGDIVAFIDSDARPDEDWLTHIALALESPRYVGVGGPNVAPPGDDGVAACVANAPGGPLHVLRNDHEADHIPGCNMAFHKWALDAVGGFDAAFRVAGDDVDLCWRLQARGWVLGFAPGAVVLHHPRTSIPAFWRQQWGYGAAEALLEAKWPEKHNSAGHVMWRGRVYGPPSVVFRGGRGRIYQGVWGEAAYQHREPSPASWIWEVAAMPEWYGALAALAGLSLLGVLWPPLRWAAPLLAAAATMTVVRAVRASARARFPDGPGSLGRRLERRLWVVILHLVQPAARVLGRLIAGAALLPARAPGGPLASVRGRRFALWRERGETHARTVTRIEEELTRAGAAVRRCGPYDRWDLQVSGGSLGMSRLRCCSEDHGHGRQLFRAEARPGFSILAAGFVAAGSYLAVRSAADGAWAVAGILAMVAAAVAFRTLWESLSATSVLTGALVAADEAVAARRAPAEPAEPAEPATPPCPGPAEAEDLRMAPLEAR